MFKKLCDVMFFKSIQFIGRSSCFRWQSSKSHLFSAEPKKIQGSQSPQNIFFPAFPNINKKNLLSKRTKEFIFSKQTKYLPWIRRSRGNSWWICLRRRNSLTSFWKAILECRTFLSEIRKFNETFSVYIMANPYIDIELTKNLVN